MDENYPLCEVFCRRMMSMGDTIDLDTCTEHCDEQLDDSGLTCMDESVSDQDRSLRSRRKCFAFLSILTRSMIF